MATDAGNASRANLAQIHPVCVTRYKLSAMTYKVKTDGFVTEVKLAYSPAIPLALEDLGTSRMAIMDLLLRHVHLEGLSSLESCSKALKLSIPIVENVFRQFRQQRLIDVKGSVGDDYRFELTNSGREQAAQRFGISRYVGPAPVSLREYFAATKAQAANVELDRWALREALADLAITDQMLDQLGPAVISQTSLFLYGPTGNGKTSIAERLLRIYQDAILIPYAIEVDGKTIVMFDPTVHRPLDVETPDLDPRWILCNRPYVIVGGELIGSMLELQVDELSGVFAAPLQLKANNGVFLIDDFGRQIMSPRELLNRWIVPLDRRVDYLTLPTGVKFQVPFEMLVVFATNLHPSQLADDAFLRRIRNKVYVAPVDAQIFDRIWRRAVTGRNMPYDPAMSEYARELCLQDGRVELRACYPSDICNILLSIHKYEKRPVQVTRADLERAVSLYFTNPQ